MGMFDYIRCEYPLPDGESADGIEFQTKDTDAQYLDTYTISEDGQLFDQEGAAIPFHGDINFYSSNISGSCPDGVLTKNNEPATYWDYTARFTEGKVTKITGQKTINHDERVMTREQFHAWRRPQAIEPDAREGR